MTEHKCSVVGCKYPAIYQVKDLKTRELRKTCGAYMTTKDLIISKFKLGNGELVEKRQLKIRSRNE